METEFLINYLEIKGDSIYLPIEGYMFELSRKSAVNMALALLGSIARMEGEVLVISTKREHDGTI